MVGGSSNKQLADEIAEEMGLKCGKVTLGRYADGEVMVQLDEHVRGKGAEERGGGGLQGYREEGGREEGRKEGKNGGSEGGRRRASSKREKKKGVRKDGSKEGRKA